jgi:hypothetical protein
MAGETGPPRIEIQKAVLDAFTKRIQAVHRTLKHVRRVEAKRIWLERRSK